MKKLLAIIPFLLLGCSSTTNGNYKIVGQWVGYSIIAIAFIAGIVEYINKRSEGHSNRMRVNPNVGIVIIIFTFLLASTQSLVQNTVEANHQIEDSIKQKTIDSLQRFIADSTIKVIDKSIQKGTIQTIISVENGVDTLRYALINSTDKIMTKLDESVGKLDDRNHAERVKMNEAILNLQSTNYSDFTNGKTYIQSHIEQLDASQLRSISSLIESDNYSVEYKSEILVIFNTTGRTQLIIPSLQRLFSQKNNLDAFRVETLGQIGVYKFITNLEFYKQTIVNAKTPWALLRVTIENVPPKKAFISNLLNSVEITKAALKDFDFNSANQIKEQLMSVASESLTSDEFKKTFFYNYNKAPQ